MLNFVKEPIFVRFPKEESMIKITDATGRELPQILLNLRREVKNPLSIYTYPKAISLDNQIYIHFKTEEGERFFIQELHFLLEQVNNVSPEYRVANHQIESTYKEVLKGRK